MGTTTTTTTTPLNGAANITSTVTMTPDTDVDNAATPLTRLTNGVNGVHDGVHDDQQDLHLAGPPAGVQRE